ncbi:MAG: radical SAM family heme chaperone HemW [Thiolinea sp.]
MYPIPLTLYIHIPWCIRKCPYCDFNSHAADGTLPEQAYIQALLDDLASELPAIWGRSLSAIFIGGGTPSLLSAAGIDTLLSGIRALLPFRPNLEVTLEANPGTFEQDKFTGFREAGINRLSVGIQSFNPQHLQALGRVHDREEALRAADIAQQAGFDNFNLDLMFGLPRQTAEQALADLQQAIDLAPPHLSWYQLTLEPNTLFYQQPPVLPDDDALAEIQIVGQDLISRSCYTQYEVSAYAQTGKECLHNRNYWEFGDYLGIGAGAHGKLTDPHGTVTRYRKFRQPTQYLQQMQADGQARSREEILTPADLQFEFMLNALRLKQGFPAELFTQRTGLPVPEITERLESAVSLGLLSFEQQHIQPTDRGWLYLNDLIQLFLEE